jgi:exonuclease SbcC
VLRIRGEQKTAAPLLQEIRALDQQLTDRKKNIDSGGADCRAEEKLIRADKDRKLQEEKKLAAAKEEAGLAAAYLKVNSKDEWLVSGLAGIEEQLRQMLSLQNDIAAKEKAGQKAEKTLRDADAGLIDCANALRRRRREVADARKALAGKKEQLTALLGTRLLREYRAQKEALLRENALRQKIADLETERARLHDGKPCPLCGSETHPFALGNVPAVAESEKKITGLTAFIRRAEELEAAIKGYEEAEKEALQKLTAAEKTEAAAASAKENAVAGRTAIIADMEDMTRRLDDLRQAVLAKLQPLGIREIPQGDAALLLDSLKIRLKDWQLNLQKKTEIEGRISQLESELRRLDAVLGTRSGTLAARQTALAGIKKEFSAVKNRRQELFGGKSPDAEEKRLESALIAAELAEKSARNSHDEAGRLLATAQADITRLRQQIEQRDAELRPLESGFADAVKAAGFADEKRFIAARLPLPEREKLVAMAGELDRRQADLHARKNDRESRLAAEIARKVSSAKPEELEIRRRECEDSLKGLRDALAGARYKLRANATAKERLKGKQAAIEARQQECRRWERLHGLIGSADGKKYRNFAQGLTFEIMVSQANRQLEKMTDRYLLLRDDRQPLALNVLDNYQAGEIRSTKNLSGGECFIVSLSLALGLSKMASRKVRVDSLFLDEGFGSLDEEALDAALETLGGLQQDGKLIGLISHVPALKERIGVQINIAPLSGGKSRISGPGCERLLAPDEPA